MKRLSFATAALPVLVMALLGGEILLGSCTASTSPEAERVRKPVVAGLFYAKDPKALRSEVTDLLKARSKERFPHPLKALLTPHAGYRYCAGTMAAVYAQIEGPSFEYDTVVLIGPSHRAPTKAAAVSSADVWETPLGPIRVDTGLTRALVSKHERIEFDDRAHVGEHSLEAQLPFLIVAAGRKPFKIVPLVTSSSDPSDIEIVARALVDIAAGARTLVVVSSDLSHYPSKTDAEKVDNAILGAVTSLDVSKILGENRKLLQSGYEGLSVAMCGLDATLCVIKAASRLGITEGRVMSYSNSGMSGGDDRRVVGYGGMVFIGGEEVAGAQGNATADLKFSESSEQELISLARAAAKSAVEGERVSYDPSNNPELQLRAGCFVTLKNKSALRGCIGQFTSDEPLWKTVREMAVSSATRDYRFAGNPVTSAEVPELNIEISVLSPLKKISEPLKEIKLGRDGILIQDKGRTGTFLPQVATDTGWSLEEFLGHCANDKAGLGWEGWKSSTATIYTYTSTIIDEKELQRPGRK